MESPNFEWKFQPQQKNEIMDKESKRVRASQQIKGYLEQSKNHWRQAIPLTIILIILLALLFTRSPQSKVSAPVNNTAQYIEVMAPLMPIAKGSVLDFSTFDVAHIKESTLTASQRNQVVKAEQVQNLNGKLRAKKLLAPNKPILWSDLNYNPEQESFTKKPKIIFAQ